MTKVCLPMVVDEGVSTVDVGNDQNFCQAEGKTKKPKRILTAQRKKKRQQIKHRKLLIKRVLGTGKLRPNQCAQKQKEKKACSFYARGRCGKGTSCPFSHDITPETKSEVCKYFISNRCLRGDDCPYSHALSTFPCRFFHLRGKCMDADSCRFSHEPISEEAKQRLLAKVEQEQVCKGNKVMNTDGLGCINRKRSVSASDLELFPLGGKRANKTPLKVTDAAASKISHLDMVRTSSTFSMAKKAASTYTGGEPSINASNLEVKKSLCFGGLLDRRGPLGHKSSVKGTTPTSMSARSPPPAQATGFPSNANTTQERKTKVDAFLQAQLDNSHLMRKLKLGTGLESSGGCYTLSNQPRALSMGQTSLSKTSDLYPSIDVNTKAMASLPKASNLCPSTDARVKATGLLQATADCGPLVPMSNCAGTKSNSESSMNQQKSVSNGKSLGINASMSSPSVLGPSLLDMVSMSESATFSKGSVSTSGLPAPTINATPKRSMANVFLDRFLKG